MRTSMMHYFDSRETEIKAEHILASGALPPAFPAVRIDGELYWDGGILSNTPTEAIFDDDPRRNSLIFAVHMWNPTGPEPDTIWEVLHRQKDIQYSSRIANHIMRQREAHRLRHVINELVKCMPDEARRSTMVRELAAYGCPTRMHVVRLLAPRLENESHIKDIDFSPSGIRSRWQAGYGDTCRALARAPGQLHCHQDFIEIAIAPFERLLLALVFLEPETGIETARRFVTHDGGQLDHLDPPARGLDDRFDQPASDTAPSRLGPDIHADKVPLVGHLGALEDDERGDADKPLGAEGAEHMRGAEPLHKPAQGLRAFRLERTCEGVGREL